MKVAAIVALLAAASAVDLMSWWQLPDGSRWVYDYEFRTGEAAHPYVERWREVVTVTGHVDTREGLVILRSVRIEGVASPPTGFAENRSPYLWRGNCLYVLYPEMWDGRRFTPEFRKMLGQTSAEACFPLVPGKRWRSGFDWPLRVDGRGPLPQRGPQDVPRDAIRVVQETSSGPNYAWFEKGTGKVASWSWHNGTYSEEFERLVRR